MGLFSSIIGGVSSLLGGGGSGKAAKQAAQIQADAARAGIAESTRQFDISRADQLPWLDAGKSALDQQMALLGIGAPGIISGYGGGTFDLKGRQVTPPDRQNDAINQLEQSPMFQSLMRNGQNLILANGSATGGLRGGDIQQSFADFGRDSLSQVIQQQLANLGGISAQGGATGAGLGALGAGYAANNANLLGQGASATAGGILLAQQAKNQNMNSLLGSLGQFGQDSGLDTALSSVFKKLF